MAFYELAYWRKGNKIEEDSLSAFMAALDGYTDAVLEDGDEDNDAFWDDFWGGSYMVNVDGQEYTPADFITGAYWAGETVGESIRYDWFRPGSVHRIDDLYTPF